MIRVTAAENRTGSYRQLFGHPGLRRLAGADVCARLPQGMVSITLLLVVARHASFPVAGAAVGGYSLGQGLTAPIRGRLADLRGLRVVAPVCLCGYVSALVALALAARAQSPVPGLLIATAALAGLVTPPLSPAMRSLWALRTPAALRHTGFALDAAVFDLTAIAGPALAGALATAVAPGTALGVLLALTVVAAVIVSREPGRPAVRLPGAGWAGPLRSRALRRLLVTAALTNWSLSATEVALTGFARHAGALWASGPLLAAVSVGSIVGSLALGRRGGPPGGARRGLPLLLAGYTLGLTALTAATAFAPLMALAAPAAGLCLGPTLASLFTAAADAAPAGAAIEAQSWVNTIMSGGASAGAALAGLSAPRPVLGLALAAGTAGVAALSALTRGGGARSGPEPAPRPPES